MRESSILTDPQLLSHSYIPERLLFRDRERSQLLSFLLNKVNTFVYGPGGCGKTALLKSAIEQFNSGSSAKAVYVDATLYQTTNSILQEILSTVSPLSTIPKSNSQLIHRLLAKAKRTRMIVCVDHFQRVREISVIDKLLSLGIGLILVSEDSEYFKRLSKSMRSRIVNFLHIPRYTDDQVRDILLERAKLALREDAYDKSLIRRISERCKGNGALGISLLKVCATKAQSENRRSVLEPDISTSIIADQKLTDDEQTIFEILKENRKLPTTELYDIYRQTAEQPKSRRSFREYMRRLKARGLVRAVGEKRWRVYEVCGD